jgi:hypothetical protein
MATARSRLSATAHFAVPGGPRQPVQFGYQALLDGSAVTNRLARELLPIAADLLEIAAMVYVIDQRVARRKRPDRDLGATWARELNVEIPVRLPELWNVHGNSLAGLLAWLTDDTWTLTFTGRDDGTGPLDVSQGFLFDMVPEGAAPVLFSGGLDSGAGLAAYLTGADAVAVSIDTNNWMQHVQQEVVRELNRVSQHACVPLRYRVSSLQQKHATETSQRSRGLLFLAAGIATAWTLHHDRLQVFENGIGAFNLPYLRSQSGSEAGTCTSCILRRQAVQAAGKAHLDAGTAYWAGPLEESLGLRVMRWQECRLRACIEQDDPWSALVLEFPELLDTAPLTPTEVVGLYRSYVREWEDLPEAFRPQIGRTAAL